MIEKIIYWTFSLVHRLFCRRCDLINEKFVFLIQILVSSLIKNSKRIMNFLTFILKFSQNNVWAGNPEKNLKKEIFYQISEPCTLFKVLPRREENIFTKKMFPLMLEQNKKIFYKNF